MRLASTTDASPVALDAEGEGGASIRQREIASMEGYYERKEGEIEGRREVEGRDWREGWREELSEREIEYWQ